MRPSIMSLGATTSAPARAWETAARAISSTLESLSTRPSRVEQAAVAVVGVLAEADVGHDEQLGVRLLDRARGELDDALVVVGAGALGVLRSGIPKSRTAGRPSACGVAGLLDGRGDAQAIDAGQRGDRLAAGLRVDEQRQDEVGRDAGASRARGRAGPASSAAGAGVWRGRACPQA